MEEDKSKDGNDIVLMMVGLVTNEPDPVEHYCCSQLTSGLRSKKD